MNQRKPIKTVKITCIFCGNNVFKRKGSKYCSYLCNAMYWKHRKTRQELEKLRIKNCLNCNKKFKTERYHSHQKFCSQDCYDYYRNPIRRFHISIEEYRRITSKCIICGFSEIVDCHHIIPKSKGGKNIITNYIGLCPNHHKLVHLKRYSILDLLSRELNIKVDQLEIQTLGKEKVTLS